MANTKSVQVTCDMKIIDRNRSPVCAGHLPAEPTVREARAHMKKKKWIKTADGLDQCPPCQNYNKQPVEDEEEDDPE